MSLPESDRLLYAEYRRGIERERLPRSLLTGVYVLFVIQTVFIFVDWLVYPETFWRFLPVRLALNVVLGIIYFFTARTHPLASAFAACLAGGAMLLMVTQGTGGVESSYYVGLVLLFIGLGVLLPLSGVQAASIVSALLAAYTALPLLEDKAANWELFGLHFFFLSAAAFEGVMSCMLLNRMRFVDFKQRRELERARDELREMDRAKSRFTANIHHELRTPLTLTLVPLEGLLGGEFGEVSELQRSYLKTMQMNSLRLLKLINDLLDLAKIESRQLALRRSAVAVGRLVGDVVAGARPMADRKGIAVSSEGLDSLPVIQADPDALEKVVVNLLGNALKFTDAGGRIAVRAQPRECGVHLVVEDTGVGIPDDQLERIFDRFAQVDTSATRRHEGTGIGLSLCKELVELHGGRIWAESEGLGQGTRIHVELPPGEADAGAEEEVVTAMDGRRLSAGQAFDALAAEMDLSSPGGEPSGLVELERHVERWEAERGEDSPEALDLAPASAPEILVAEDNADMRRLLHFLLAREFRVRLTRNGREALEAVRASKPNLVLTDVMMPEMSGTELCRALKADPDTQGIPVVLVTSKAEREMKIEGLELGADDYVTKPFHPRELMARVRSLVRLRQVQEELAQRNADLERALAELKDAEVQLVQVERLSAVGELAAGIAHEVNNPVNFAMNSLHALRSQVNDVRGLVARLVEFDWRDESKLAAHAFEIQRLQEQMGFDELTETLGELMEIVAEGLDRTRRLVGNLRDFASPGEGPRRAVDLRKGIDSTLQLLRHALQQARVQVETAFDPDLPAVRGDPRALNQVFLNLFKNAAETLEERGGTIRVVARREGASVCVEVQDDGPGIAPEARGRLFEPFFTTKRAGRGTGLGLSISRRIVVAHGGVIDVDSTPGQGTRVIVRLPIEDSERAA